MARTLLRQNFRDRTSQIAVFLCPNFASGGVRANKHLAGGFIFLGGSMAKRLTDTEKWSRPWFRHLSIPHKVFWLYICDTCDIAGVWYVDFELASFLVGSPLDRDELKQVFSKQITEFKEGTRWLINDFVAFQYGKLIDNNNMHRSVINLLAKHKISGANEGLMSPLAGAMDKDKDKNMVKDKEKEGSAEQRDWFEKLWEEFPAKGRVGKKLAFRHFISSVQDLATARRCAEALDKYIDSKRVKEGFVQNSTTWFNNWQDWEHYEEAKDGTVRG